ncbi:MAG TPA: MFS transporter, partial [Acidobacteriota bacterium]|nr:MFS transporter [Acidobacteriota bacterium]
VPSYISKITSATEQGSVLGVAGSVSSIAQIPGPIIGGFLFEFAGQTAPFFASAAILFIAFIIAFKIFFPKRKENKIEDNAT